MFLNKTTYKDCLLKATIEHICNIAELCVLQVSSSFPGCVRSVSLNNAHLDLSKPQTQQNLTSCFSSDQRGSHFNGTGFALLSESHTDFIQPSLPPLPDYHPNLCFQFNSCF